MEGLVQILDEGLFYLSCCHKIGNSKAMREGESITLCASGIAWNWDNEGNVRALAQKILCSPAFRCCYYFSILFLCIYFYFIVWFDCFVYADSFWFILNVYVVPLEVPCDVDLL